MKLTLHSEWTRIKDGRKVRIIAAKNINSGTVGIPYFDIGWETLDKAFRRGACYEETWFKRYEPVKK